jgi:hypothetical protein
MVKNKFSCATIGEEMIFLNRDNRMVVSEAILIKDERRVNETHIPYIGNHRVPFWCFGEFNKNAKRCKHCFYIEIIEACKGKRYDLVQWSPIIMTVSKSL